MLVTDLSVGVVSRPAFSSRGRHNLNAQANRGQLLCHERRALISVEGLSEDAVILNTAEGEKIQYQVIKLETHEWVPECRAACHDNDKADFSVSLWRRQESLHNSQANLVLVVYKTSVKEWNAQSSGQNKISSKGYTAESNRTVKQELKRVQRESNRSG
uniref:Uncharacterized protein n=1 Tax=Sphaerodactylus townsendi TaxID=933632 RepID=A0ACB8E993_9SAUR